jgi:hypothetical protein
VTGALSSTTFAPDDTSLPMHSGWWRTGHRALGRANAVVNDMTPLVGGQIAQSSDALRDLLLHRFHYSGLQLPAAIQNAGVSSPQVTAGFPGLTGFSVTLHGLNGTNNYVPDELKPFSRVLFWQNQANTTLSYNPDASLNTTCGDLR